MLAYKDFLQPSLSPAPGRSGHYKIKSSKALPKTAYKDCIGNIEGLFQDHIGTLCTTFKMCRESRTIEALNRGGHCKRALRLAEKSAATNEGPSACMHITYPRPYSIYLRGTVCCCRRTEALLAWKEDC